MLLSCKTISRSLVRWAVKTGQVATALWSDEATNVIARLLELDDKVETSNVGKLVWFDAARRCAAEAASEAIRAWELEDVRSGSGAQILPNDWQSGDESEQWKTTKTHCPMTTEGYLIR